MKHITTFIFIMLISLSTQSQNWVNFSKNDNIRCSMVDGSSLWIGSLHGLLHYDMIMDTFYLYNASNSGLLENNIDAIEMDSLGKLYIATSNEGLVIFENGEWEAVDVVNEYLAEEYYMNYISDIFVDEDNVVWMASSKGLLQLEGEDLTTYNEDNSDIPGDQIFSVYKEDETLWLGSYSLVTFDGDSWEQFNSENTNLPMGSFHDFKKDFEGNLWCVGNRSLVKIEDGAFVNYPSPIDGVFYSFVIEPNNDIYVGMMQGDDAFLKFQNLTWTDYNPSNCGIINENVFYVDRDEQNNKYFMGDNGLDILSNDGQWFHREISNSDLPNNYIPSMDIDKDGKNAFCTRRGIVEYNWEEWSEIIDMATIDQIAYDQNGNLIMANAQELYIFDGESMENIHTPFYNYIANGPVEALTLDKDNNIWMSFPSDIYYTISGGIYKYDGSVWTTYTTENSALPSSEVKDILADQANNIWFATANGLAKYDQSNWEIFNASNSSLPYDFIGSITQDSENKIWISTEYDIVASFDGIDWNVYDSPTYPYLSDLSDIQFDSKGNLWGVGLNKIAKFDLEEWETFDMHNSPLPHNNTVSLGIDRNDNIFIGTAINGLYIFNENGLNPVITGSEERVSLEESNQIAYPNPTAGSIYIDLRSITANKEVAISLYDINGAEVFHKTYAYQIQLELDFSALVNGVYLLKVESENQTFSQKLIVN